MYFELNRSQFARNLFVCWGLISLFSISASLLPLILSIPLALFVFVYFLYLIQRFSRLKHPSSVIAMELLEDPPGALIAYLNEKPTQRCRLVYYHRGPGWYLLMGRNAMGASVRIWVFFDSLGQEARSQLARFLLEYKALSTNTE